MSLERIDGQRYRYTGQVASQAETAPSVVQISVPSHTDSSSGLAAYKNRQRASVERSTRQSTVNIPQEPLVQHAQVVGQSDELVVRSHRSDDSSGPPFAAMLLHWQMKCDHLTSRLESEQLRSDELMDECQRLREKVKEHASNDDALGQPRKLVEHLQQQLLSLQSHRASDLELIAAQARRISDLETTLLEFQNVEKRHAASQTSVAEVQSLHLGSLYHSQLPVVRPSTSTLHHRVDELVAIGQSNPLHQFDDVIITTVTSPTRYSPGIASVASANHLRNDRDAPRVSLGEYRKDFEQPAPQQQQHPFVRSIQQAYMEDPELSDALGQLFITNKRQRMRSKLKVVEAPLVEKAHVEAPAMPVLLPSTALPQVEVAQSGVMKYNAHEGLSSNPFEFDLNEEIEMTPTGIIATLPAAVTPKPTKSQAVVSGQQPSTPPLRTTTNYPSRGEMNSLFSSRSSNELSTPGSPNLVSTVVSSASSNEAGSPTGQSGRKENRPPLGWFDLEPLQIRLEATMNEANASATTPRALDATRALAAGGGVGASRSSSVGNQLVKSPSPQQPSTPLPPTPSSQSPLRSRESVDRIDKLRHELQSLIDMRARLNSSLTDDVGPPSHPVQSVFNGS